MSYERLRFAQVEHFHAFHVPEHAPAEIGKIRHVEVAALPAHQVDQLALERIAQRVRDAGRGERHEIACGHFVLGAVDAREAAAFQDVDPLLFLPVRVIANASLPGAMRARFTPVRRNPVALPIW